MGSPSPSKSLVSTRNKAKSGRSVVSTRNKAKSGRSLASMRNKIKSRSFWKIQQHQNQNQKTEQSLSVSGKYKKQHKFCQCLQLCHSPIAVQIDQACTVKWVDSDCVFWLFTGLTTRHVSYKHGDPECTCWSFICRIDDQTCVLQTW